MDNRIIRGWIVRILQRAYPAGLEERGLHKQLHGLGYAVSRTELAANIAYLAEDRFVEEQRFGAAAFDEGLGNRIYKLTTKGIDLAEKSISDTGVEIG